MKKVLITGAQGFIGKKLMAYFSSKGWNVIGWGRRTPESGETQIKKVDMIDAEEVQKNLKTDSPDVIIHCAGCADVSKSIQSPETDFRGNVFLTYNLLLGICRIRMDNIRIVFISSAAVYGNPVTLPITEDMVLNPLSPYALHKIMCEELCKYFLNNYGINIKIARVFSAYGRGLKKQIFWDMYHKYLKKGYIELFGTGEESRDYIHIEDLAKAIFLIATSDSGHMLYNVANGKATTIRYAAECFAKCANITPEKVFFNGVVREGDPRNWCADISRLHKLGYEQSVALQDGLADYIRWIERDEYI